MRHKINQDKLLALLKKEVQRNRHLMSILNFAWFVGLVRFTFDYLCNIENIKIFDFIYIFLSIGLVIYIFNTKKKHFALIEKSRPLKEVISHTNNMNIVDLENRILYFTKKIEINDNSIEVLVINSTSISPTVIYKNKKSYLILTSAFFSLFMKRPDKANAIICHELIHIKQQDFKFAALPKIYNANTQFYIFFVLIMYYINNIFPLSWCIPLAIFMYFQSKAFMVLFYNLEKICDFGASIYVNSGVVKETILDFQKPNSKKKWFQKYMLDVNPDINWRINKIEEYETNHPEIKQTSYFVKEYERIVLPK